MPTLKSQILEVASAMPDGCTLEDFRYRLYLQLKAQEGLQAIEAGEICTREEALASVESGRLLGGNSKSVV